MGNKCFKISANAADRRQKPPARLLNDLFSAADKLTWLRVPMTAGTDVGYSGVWYVMPDSIQCNTDTGTLVRVGNFVCGLYQNDINTWHTDFEAGDFCGGYGADALELMLDSETGTEKYLTCNDPANPDAYWEFIENEGYYSPTHPLVCQGLLGSQMEFVAFPYPDTLNTWIEGDIWTFDYDTIRTWEKGITVNNAWLELTVNTLPTRYTQEIDAAWDGGGVTKNDLTNTNETTGNIDLVLVSYATYTMKELYAGAPCPFTDRTHLYIERGVQGVSIAGTGTYVVDITDIMQYVLDHKDTERTYGLMIGYLADNITSAQSGKQSMFALRDATFTITGSQWLDDDNNTCGEYQSFCQWINAEGCLDLLQVYVNHEHPEASLSRDMVYGNLPGT